MQGCAVRRSARIERRSRRADKFFASHRIVNAGCLDMSLVIVNIGWSTSYTGLPGDAPVGGHAYLQTHEDGHESWNFLPTDGKYYGYVPGHSTINIRKLGAGANDLAIEDATVVWVARSPRTQRTYVVGWYSGATIHGKDHMVAVERAGVGPVQYQIEVPIDGGTLLEPEQRMLRVPTAKVPGNMGQRPIWYGNADFNASLAAYIAADGVLAPTGPRGTPKQPDSDLRRRVEEAAIEHAKAHFRSKAGGSRDVKTVEDDNVGWDLEASAGDEVLKIEVKGLSGGSVCVELTPNEYKKMLSPANRKDYVVYVVTNALEPEMRSHVFYYNAKASLDGNHVWAADDGRILSIEPIMAARLSAAAVQ